MLTKYNQEVPGLVNALLAHSDVEILEPALSKLKAKRMSKVPHVAGVNLTELQEELRAVKTSTEAFLTGLRVGHIVVMTEALRGYKRDLRAGQRRTLNHLLAEAKIVQHDLQSCGRVPDDELSLQLERGRIEIPDLVDEIIWEKSPPDTET